MQAINKIGKINRFPPFFFLIHFIYISLLLSAIFANKAYPFPVTTKSTKITQRFNNHFHEKIILNAVINPFLKLIKGNETIELTFTVNKNKLTETRRKFRTKSQRSGRRRSAPIYLKLKDHIYLMLYPNKFSEEPLMMRDYNFHQVYPYNFNRGFIKIKKLSISIGIIPLKHGKQAKFDGPGKINRLKLTYFIHVSFTTLVPAAFGNFGGFKKEMVLNAPFYPYAAINKNANPPVNTLFNINIRIKNGYEGIFNGKIYKHRIVSEKSTNFLSLVLAPSFIKQKTVYKNISINFYDPSSSPASPVIFSNSVKSYRNEKLDGIAVLLSKYYKMRLKHITFVYVHLRRSLWLKPPLFTDTLLIAKRFGNVFPYFYIYQKFNVLRGLIYLNISDNKKIKNDPSFYCNPLYSQKIRRSSYSEFKTFLAKYSKKNPNVKAIIKKFNFIKGVNTVEHYPKFPLYYVYFTRYKRLHRLKNSVYYYNNSLSEHEYEKIERKFIKLKKTKNSWNIFLSSIGGNFSPNSGRISWYLNLIMTKKYSYRNSFMLSLFQNYYNRGVSFGFAHTIGRFFPILQKYKQTVYGDISIIETKPAAPGNSFLYSSAQRLAELTAGYRFNSQDYNINPLYGSSFNINFNIANSNFFSPFSFTQTLIEYTKNIPINANNIIALRGLGVLSSNTVPTGLDYDLGGINGIMGIPANIPFVANDTLIGEVDYRRNIIRGLNIDLFDNLMDITAVTGDIIGGAGKIGNTVSSLINKGPLYSFAGVGLHFKMYFFGIYPEMISVYAAKAFGSGVSSEYGPRFYIGLNQIF